MSEYADHPVSITEAKAERTQACDVWTPRDALINLLREIDRGEADVDALVIAYRQAAEDGQRTRFTMACPNLVTGLGLVSRAAWLMNHD